jgi:hypothetical protein
MLSSSHLTALSGFLAVTLFLLIGLAFVPYPGLQNDECLFVQPLYSAFPKEYRINVFHTDASLMLMTYLGTLKTWVYAPFLGGKQPLFTPNVWIVRVPPIVTGCLTIWMFLLFLKRVSGPFGAICGTFLLALDPSFLLTTVFDWGPVAFQHFFLVASLLALRIFWESKSLWALAAGFASLGLGMWDKALFSWTLAGMGIASILLFSKDILKLITVSRVAVAAASFLLGVWPLLLYNVRSDWETFRGNAKISRAEILPKSTLLWATLNGRGLFGYLTLDGLDPTPVAPKTALEVASTRLRDLTGSHRENSMSWALGLTLLAAPLWWRKAWKLIAFSLLTSLIAWILMAATKGAGGSVHHVVLFWPLPQALLAAGLAGVADYGKWPSRLAAAVIVVLSVQNLLVLNESFYDLFRDGEGDAWTDAIYPLQERLARQHPLHVNMMDWGFEYNLMALSGGKLALRWGAEPGERPVATEDDRRLLTAFLEDPGSIWVRRRIPIEMQPGTIERYRQRALQQGYREEILETIQDRNHRPTFEVYRFVRAGK